MHIRNRELCTRNFQISGHCVLQWEVLWNVWLFLCSPSNDWTRIIAWSWMWQDCFGVDTILFPQVTDWFSGCLQCSCCHEFTDILPIHPIELLFSPTPEWRHSTDTGKSQGPWGSGESPPQGKGYCWHAGKGITRLDISSVVFFLRVVLSSERHPVYVEYIMH